jgi:uncharacterized protein YyaL (SSP411 family)
MSVHKTLVNWREWNEESFETARRENKPVLLDISATWCYWCHRIDQDTYSEPEVAAIVNSEFVPIRVDNDRRPDINRRYNMGGWPTTAFLTPDGRTISGGTYIPPGQMKLILREVAEYWKRNAGKPAPEIQEEFEVPQEEIRLGKLEPAIVEEIVGEIVNNYDELHGGFGQQPKFPHTDALELALARHVQSGNREYLKIVTRTLTAMAKGGVYDAEMGGFFRYSTNRDWSIPHFEKMTEDNAKLLRLLIEAHQLTGDPFLLQIAQQVIQYVDSTLSDRAKGGFYGSQDADEEYYRLKKEERSAGQAPFVDKTLYSNWNGLMIYPYLLASFVLNDPEPREFALKTLERIISLMYEPGKGFYHYHDGQRNLPLQLGDQVFMTRALLDAFEATAETKYLTFAEETMVTCFEHLYDQKFGGFHDAPVDANAQGFLRKPAKSLDENSAAAIVLMRLHYLTGKGIYRNRAEETLSAFVVAYAPYGIMAADYANALEWFLKPATTINIVGDASKPATKGMIAESWKTYQPRKVVQVLDPKRDQERILNLGYGKDDKSRAYICVGQMCLAPVVEPKQIQIQLSGLLTAKAS